MRAYACYDGERSRKPLRVQDGWTEDGRRKLIWIPPFGTVKCQYDQAYADPRCSGCVHGNGAEPGGT